MKLNAREKQSENKKENDNIISDLKVGIETLEKIDLKERNKHRKLVLNEVLDATEIRMNMV